LLGFATNAREAVGDGEQFHVAAFADGAEVASVDCPGGDVRLSHGGQFERLEGEVLEINGAGFAREIAGCEAEHG
jgi:hypothetical protein